MSEVEQSPENELAAGPRKSGNAWKWWMTGVLFLATVLTYLDRQTLSICENKIRAEFHLNDEQYGYLLASFRWTYALMQLPAGMLADRLSVRMTYGLAVGLWSLAGAAAAVVFRFPAFLISRAVLGMGESFNWPCASRIVANTFSSSDRSLASGVFNSGAALGSVIAPALVGGLAMAFGWRAAFMAMGSLGAFWLLLWFAVTTSRSPCHASVKSPWIFTSRGNWVFAVAFIGIGIVVPAIVVLFGPRLIEPMQIAYRAAWIAQATVLWALGLVLVAILLGVAGWSLLRWRSKAVGFWMLLIVSMTVNPCWYFMNEWLIKSLREDRGLDGVTIGGIAWTLIILTIILFVADLGNLISGGAIKYLVRRGWSLRAARGTAMIGAACAIAPVTVVSYVEDLAAATAMFGLAGMGLTAIVASFTACQQDLSFKRVGLMSGFVGMSANIVTAIANPAIGAHHDATHSYRLIFYFLGLLPLISVAAILVFDSVVHGGKAGGRKERAEAR
jgi:ACS family hexuronate transporter-like MFS transporter